MKRIISILIIISMTIGLSCSITSCKGENTSDSSDVLKGKTIRIASWGNVKPQAGTEVGDLRLEQLSVAEEKYGCKVEYLTITDLTQQLLTAATTGQVIAEVCMHRSHRVVELLMQGDYFYSLDEIGGKSDNKLYNSDTKENTTYNGKTYGFWYDPTNIANVMVFNKSMLQRNGIELPYSAVKNRQWTFDAWLDIMKKTTDPANNTFGCGTAGIFPTQIMYANNASIYTVADGVHKQNVGDNKLLEAFEFMSNCVIKNKVMEFNIGVSNSYAYEQFMQGRYATIVTGLYVIRDFLKGGMSDEFGILPLPMGPSADEYVNGDSEVKTFCIQKAVPKEEAEALLKFMDEAFVYPLDKHDGVYSYYESLCPDAESLEVLMMLQDIPVTVYKEYTAPDLRGSNTTITSDFALMASGQKPIKSTLDSHANEIQALLDEYYK